MKAQDRLQPHREGKRSGAKKESAIGLRSAITCLALFLLAPWPSHAEDTRLLSVGIRGGVTGASVLGEEQQETFREYDAVATIGLPWGWYSKSGWGVGTRLIAGAGVIQETGSSGLIGSLIPVFALGSQDGRFSLDAGIGGALLSTHHFGKQNFGGPFQIAATVGVGVPLYERLGIGYRFQHYSDAGLHGSDSRGADFHMLELTYRY